MCGIYGVICPKHNRKTEPGKSINLEQVKQRHKVLRHRGPDWEGELERDNYYMAHHRLSIVDPAGGSQPIVYTLKPGVTGLDGSTPKKEVCAAYYSLCVNGEIYNYRELKDIVTRPLKINPKEYGVDIPVQEYCCDPSGSATSEYYPHDEYIYKTASDCEVILSLYDWAMNYKFVNGVMF